jgi:hypothetical protein
MRNNNNMYQNHHGKDGDDKGILKHGLLMMLCCLLPVLIIGALPLIDIKGGAFTFLIFLLCPLMHMGMMFMMRKHGDKNSCHNTNENKAQLNDNE